MSAREFRLGLCAFAAFTGCGDARTLDLFAKPEPMAMAPKTPCGTLPECPKERAVCLDEQCVQCASDVDCGSEQPGCVQNTCVECSTNDHCPMDKVCNVTGLRCTEPCSEAETCKDKKRTTCDTTRALCVECTTTSECEPNRVCNLASDTCVECTSDLDCDPMVVCDAQTNKCVKP